MTKEPQQESMYSNPDHWENRTVELDENGLIQTVHAWTVYDEVSFVRQLGNPGKKELSSRAGMHDRTWWLNKYIAINEGRPERHCTAGVIEARKLLQGLWV